MCCRRHAAEPPPVGIELLLTVAEEQGLRGAKAFDVGVLRSERGYTGSESRLQMLENKEFVDARVEIFGKHGSRNWVKIGEYTIDRQLLTE